MRYLITCACLFIFNCLFSQSVSYVQIVHNSADPLLDTVDVYFNHQLLDSNIAFRTARGFFTVNTGVPDTIIIANQHSTSEADSIRSFIFTPTDANQRYALFLQGVIGNNFLSNPDGQNTSLDLKVVANVDSSATDTSIVAIRFFNGVTDLPTAKSVERVNGQALSPALVYGQSSNDVILYHRLYNMQYISPDTLQNFGTYEANLTSLGAASIVIFTSGFNNPYANNYGSSMDLFAVLPSGTVMRLPVEVAAFQLLHNSADAILDSVDVYINGDLAYQALPFRTALPTLIALAYAPYNVAIAPKFSSSVNDTFWQRNFVFARDTAYIAAMQGLKSTTGYAANPDGINTGFDVLLKTPAHYGAVGTNNFDFFVVHGVTDAPALNITANSGPDITGELSYGEQSDYISLPAFAEQFTLNDSTGATLANYYPNFSTYGNQSGVILLSGFLNPGNNSNGAAMSTYLAPVTGGTFIPLNLVSDVFNVQQKIAATVFPNPVSDMLVVHADVDWQTAKWRIINLNGAEVCNKNEGNNPDNKTLMLNVQQLPPGVYVLQLQNQQSISNIKFVVQH